MIVSCIDNVLCESYPANEADSLFKCEAQMHCLHRLFASKSGFQAFTAVTGYSALYFFIQVSCSENFLIFNRPSSMTS